MIDDKSDLIVFDRKLLEERDYWVERLSREIEVSSIKLDYQRPASYSQHRDAVEVRLSGELFQSVSKLTSNGPFLLYTLLMTALKISLFKYTGNSSIVVGSPARKRDNGPSGAANALAIIDDIDLRMSFRQLLLNVRESLLGAYARQKYPFNRIVLDLGLQRPDNRCPLFDIVLTLDSIHGDLPELRNDITISFVEGKDEIIGNFAFNNRLHRRESLERFSNHFVNVLRSSLENKEASISELRMLSEAERNQLLIECNDTRAEYQSNSRAHQLFEQQVDRAPDAIAVVFEEESFTYRELNSRANQLAHYLRGLGVGPEQLVGICLKRSMNIVVALLGALKAGGAYLPLDPDYPKERLAFILNDAQVPVLITESSLRDTLPEHAAQEVYLDTDWSDVAKQNDTNPKGSVVADNLAYVIYTSGSTGKPKGTMIAHKGLVNYLDWCEKTYRVIEGKGAPVHSPIGFDLTVTSLFPPLMAGRSVIILPEDYGIESLNNVLLAGDNFSLVKITPAHLEALSQSLPAEEAAGRTRALIIGGEALLGESLSFWQANAPETRIINEYGPTETVVGCCVYEVPVGETIAGPVPIGRPIANTQIYILDSQTQPVPVGVAGELYIGGDGVGRGYLGQQGMTAEKFVPNPFSGDSGSRMYRTGDLARYLPDLTVEFLGRNDQQVKIRGFRIELGEIESALTAHHSIREAVVMAREDAPGDKRLVAYLVSAHEQAISISELRSYLKESLPDYMVPASFVMLEAMPLTSNGKVDRRALPAPLRAEPQSSLVAPRIPVEELLAGIWAEVLKVDQVGIHDNFFEIGGHSLIASQIISRVREAFGIELPLRNLFDSPTVAGLAKSIDIRMLAGQGVQASPIEPVSRDLELPLSFAQQRLWFLDQLQPGSSIYNVPVSVRLKGSLDCDALERSVSDLIGRHESLRTNFIKANGRPLQVIRPAGFVKLPIIDLLDLAEGEAETIARRLATEEAHKPFDLAQGPLLRATLLRLAPDDHILLLTMHHIVCDGWSTGILIREMASLYEAHKEGKEAVLPQLDIQYADFAVWQREWLQGEALATQLKYWEEKLRGAATLNLPADRPRSAEQSNQGARQSLTLSPGLTEAINVLSRGEGVTVFMTLLAAFDSLLHYYSSQNDIVVGTDVANRNRAATEGLIGFFINQLVMRTDLSGDPSFRELLKRVRETALGAYAHQDLPFDKLVEELNPKRDLILTPLFQVKLVHQNAPSEVLEVSGLSLENFGYEATTTKFDLLVDVVEAGQNLVATAHYSTDLFDADTISQMLGQYERVLGRIVSQPGARLSELVEALAEADRQRLAIKEKELEQANFQSLKNARRKQITRSKMNDEVTI